MKKDTSNKLDIYKLKTPEELLRYYQDWADNNKWFGDDEVSTAAALAIDQKLKGEGFDPNTKEFYNEIDKEWEGENEKD